METLSTQQVIDAGLDDWRELLRVLHARFETGDFAGGVAFVAAVGELVAHADHHPDLTLATRHVDIRLPALGASGVTLRDVELARRISLLAGERGVQAQPAAPTVLEIALDTADPAVIAPFWAALLTGDAGAAGGEDVMDPTGRVPLLWFQQTEPHATPRQRFHLDVWVPHDAAAGRIAAAVAAGGRVVDDAEAPSFTVLADAEGNRACVCTILDR